MFQLIAFAVFLCLFRKFHVLGNQLEVEDAPKGWKIVVRAVYISSGLVMVSYSRGPSKTVLIRIGPMHLSCLRVCRGDERICLPYRMALLGL